MRTKMPNTKQTIEKIIETVEHCQYIIAKHKTTKRNQPCHCQQEITKIIQQIQTDTIEQAAKICDNNVTIQKKLMEKTESNDYYNTLSAARDSSVGDAREIRELKKTIK